LIAPALVRLRDTDQTVADPDAPRYDSELVDQADYYVGLYDYYGYAPYWAPMTAPVPRWAATLGRPKR
jgi:hypothetical protein